MHHLEVDNVALLFWIRQHYWIIHQIRTFWSPNDGCCRPLAGFHRWGSGVGGAWTDRWFSGLCLPNLQRQIREWLLQIWWYYLSVFPSFCILNRFKTPQPCDERKPIDGDLPAVFMCCRRSERLELQMFPRTFDSRYQSVCLFNWLVPRLMMGFLVRCLGFFLFFSFFFLSFHIRRKAKIPSSTWALNSAVHFIRRWNVKPSFTQRMEECAATCRQWRAPAFLFRILHC